LTIIGLNEKEYFNAISAASAVGVVGGGIYDAVLGHCALKANAESIYTWNLKHFKRLGPDITDRVKTP
jgi:predicted nucleic acid-binding protein